MAENDFVVEVSKQIAEMSKAGSPPNDESLNRLAALIARAFKVRKFEVSILRLSADGKLLSFLVPIRLRNVGQIPVSTVHSLAAENIRKKRGEIVNNFAAYKHPTIFEAVDLSEEAKAKPIQKIVSTPMITEGKVVGIIQVSHKRHHGEPIGPDFTQHDLQRLSSIGAIIGKFLVSLPIASALSSANSLLKA
jgi:GAF domain-containing protein